MGIESWYIIYIYIIYIYIDDFSRIPDFFLDMFGMDIACGMTHIYIIILAHQNMGLHLGQIFPVAIQGEASQVARAGCRTHQGAPPGDRMGSSVDILREIYQQPWKVIF